MKHVHKQKGVSAHACKHERLIARREGASERTETRKQRSVQEQLFLLKQRPGNSRKERSRLRKQLAARR